MIRFIEEQRNCLNCRYWKTKTESSNWGECHRYPPQFWCEGESSGASFVSTNGADWCGEHKPHEVCVLPEGFILTNSNGEQIGKT